MENHGRQVELTCPPEVILGKIFDKYLTKKIDQLKELQRRERAKVKKIKQERGEVQQEIEDLKKQRNELVKDVQRRRRELETVLDYGEI